MKHNVITSLLAANEFMFSCLKMLKGCSVNTADAKCKCGIVKAAVYAKMRAWDEFSFCDPTCKLYGIRL